MTVQVRVHAELIPESGNLVWWAESPDVPGFSATADTLVELRELTEQTLREIWEDAHGDAMDIAYQMLGPEPASRGVPVEQDPDDAGTVGPLVIAV